MAAEKKLPLEGILVPERGPIARSRGSCPGLAKNVPPWAKWSR
jgi:hypothetical protein